MPHLVRASCSQKISSHQVAAQVAEPGKPKLSLFPISARESASGGRVTPGNSGSLIHRRVQDVPPGARPLARHRSTSLNPFDAMLVEGAEAKLSRAEPSPASRRQEGQAKQSRAKRSKAIQNHRATPLEDGPG